MSRNVEKEGFSFNIGPNLSRHALKILEKSLNKNLQIAQKAIIMRKKIINLKKKLIIINFQYLMKFF